LNLGFHPSKSWEREKLMTSRSGKQGDALVLKFGSSLPRIPLFPKVFKGPFARSPFLWHILRNLLERNVP
jgi:hypothetical protein